MLKRANLVVVLVMVVLVFAMAVSAVTIDWVIVGDPGNAPDDTGRGHVDYVYSISKYEVTNSQYSEFLNSVAASDTYGLYNPEMASGYGGTGGIRRSGSSGSYTYSVRVGHANMPVNYVNYYDCLRFVNWLANGQISGSQDSSTTEDGTYTFTGSTSVGGRKAGANVFLTSEDEWHKAAFYKGGSTNAGYWIYSTQSNTLPNNNPPSSDTGNSANYYNSGWAVGSPYYLTDVGSYTLSDSAYGTFDQTGNMWEWNESVGGQLPAERGGSWVSQSGRLPRWYYGQSDPLDEVYSNGIRVASFFEPAVLLSLEIVGPNEVVENSQSQYRAIAYYDNNSTSEVTDSADCVWLVEPNDNASISAGLLITELIDRPGSVTITASYTEGDNNDVAQKDVQVLTVCNDGNALEFDGVDDYIHINNNNTLGITDEITISQWIMANGNGGENDARLVRKGDVYMTAFKRWSGISFEVKLTNNSWLKAVDPTSYSQRLDQWCHVAGTYKKGDRVKLYINGELRASSATSSLSINTDTAGLAVGGTGTHENFNGVIDEVSVYNRVLSINEIRGLMHTRPDVDDPSLVVYWSFDEGQGQTAYDSSINSNNARLGSSTNNDNSDPVWAISDAPVGICYPPVAVAGPDQVAVEGDLVILDGSGSFDADEDILTFSWKLISKPSGSIAELVDPNSEQTTFIPDVPGEYRVGLVVSDDYFDSEEDEVNITVTSLVDAIEDSLDEAADGIGNLDPNTVKNSNMTNALTNKIAAVLALIDSGLYKDALAKLEKDILRKTDGCANGGEPDKNDWIETCEQQERIYPLVVETIGYVRSLME